MATLLSRKGLMTEPEWRKIGLMQSVGWEHYALYEPEPHILLFRRPAKKDPTLNYKRAWENLSKLARNRNHYWRTARCPTPWSCWSIWVSRARFDFLPVFETASNLKSLNWFLMRRETSSCNHSSCRVHYEECCTKIDHLLCNVYFTKRSKLKTQEKHEVAHNRLP